MRISKYKRCVSLSIKACIKNQWGFLRLKGTVSVISSDGLQCPINNGNFWLIQYDLVPYQSNLFISTARKQIEIIRIQNFYLKKRQYLPHY